MEPSDRPDWQPEEDDGRPPDLLWKPDPAPSANGFYTHTWTPHYDPSPLTLEDDEASQADPPELGYTGAPRAEPTHETTEWHLLSVPEEGPLFDLSATEALPETAEGPVAPRTGLSFAAIARELVETLLLTALIFISIRALGQNFRIEGYSMEPNLHQGQYLIVNKFIYYLQPPQRGDIIVFEYPRSVDRDFIKRVMGIPGDTVEVRPGQIFVNGEQIEEPYKPEQPAYSYGPITLGPNEYFVLGDNRNNSSDSHSWGPLERKYIIGKAWLSYWPPQNWGTVPNYPVQARAPDEAD
jgi:signal peptidase I